MKKIILFSALIAIAITPLYADTAGEKETTKEKSKQEYIADLSAEKGEKTIIEAARWLGAKKEKEALPALLALIDDKRVNVRIETVVALGLIADESAVEKLNNALITDNSAEVRYAALLATMRINPKKSIDAYKTSLEKETDPYIKDLLTKMKEKYMGK